MNKLFRAYAAVTVAVAAAALFVAGWHVSATDAERHWNAIAAFLVLGFLSEASYLKLRVGKAETQSSVAFIPFLAAVMLLDSGWAAVIAGGAVLGVEWVVRRKPPLRIAFNAAQMTLSVLAASWAYAALRGGYSLTEFKLSVAAMFAAVAAFFLVNTVAVSLAVASWYRENALRAWARIAGASLVYDIVTSLLAPLLAFLYVKWQIPGILFLILPIYFVRHLYQVSLQLEQVNRDLLELMVKAIEARDPYTSGHSQRVSELAESIARQLGLSSKAVDHIRTAALLHDVGKIYEEYAPLLRKEGKLNLTEKALMQTHPTRSAELVATISGFRGAIEQAVRHHHENYDGTGYPMGVSGEAIPLGARIIMIADTVDAMTTDRPYRKALSFEHVTQELERLSGKQFDPALVSVFLRSTRIREIVALRVESQRDAQQSDQLDVVVVAGSQSPALVRPSWRARLSR